MSNFSTLNVPQSLIDKLTAMGYTAPTEIQSKAIPAILEGKDILASSKTGSGKTGAFVIPLITKILENPENYALILVPTRELALQINTVIQSMRGRDQINTACVFGGASMENQIFALKKNPKIVVATPGRLQDHMKRRTIDISHFGILILDEFDRMLDMGFREDIANIVSRLPKERQTLMFSATKRGSVINQAKSYLKNFVEINIETPKETHANIEQKFIELREEEKYPTVLKEITATEGTILIFVNMKRVADDLESWLRSDGIEARAIHGDLRQRQRENITKQFREEKFKVMIATDVMARGIDIAHIKVVINYDTPRAFEDYTHRIGRTGRGGANGTAITLVTRADKTFHNNILRQIDSDTAEPSFGGRGGSGGGRGGSGGGRGGHSGGFGGQRGVHSGSTGRSFGDRKFAEPAHQGEGQRRPYGDRTERTPRDFGNSDRPQRSFDRPQRDGERSFGDRPQRSFDGERKPYAGGNSDRPQRDFGNSDRPQRSFDRPQRDGTRNPVSRVKSFFSKKKD
jgi:superfamily II DNA/RNA helicase